MENKKYKFPIAAIVLIVYVVVKMWGTWVSYTTVTGNMGSNMTFEMRSEMIFEFVFLGMILLLAIMLMLFRDSYLLLIPTIGMCLAELAIIVVSLILASLIPENGESVMEGVSSLLSGYGLMNLIYHILLLAGHIVLASVVVIGRMQKLTLLMKYSWWNAPVIYVVARLFQSWMLKGMMTEYQVSFFRAFFCMGTIDFVFILGTVFMGLFLAHPYKEEIQQVTE